ncbi:DNA methyltransferase [Flavobacterium sp.]|uniref:DNA methyltransferase n=1 Tax=Flavobacterium sp. TaxID=239 RepID=UPI0039E463E3
MKAIEKDFPFEFIDNIAEVESYRKEINRPIYHIHKWWAKRLGSVFRSIVMGTVENEWPDFYNSTFENPEKIVLDPFMGSGTTLGESLKLGYKVIGCDINPVSTFLVTQALTKVGLDELKNEFKSIETDVSQEIKKFYKTLNDGFECDVLYYFWVKEVEVNDEKILLHSSYIFSKNAYPNKKPHAQVVCPNCGDIFKCRYDSISELCRLCKKTFNPQEGRVKGSLVYDKNGESHKIKDIINKTANPPKHKLFAILALNQKGEKIYLKPSQYDLALYAQAEKRFKEIENELPLPNMQVRKGHNTDQARGYNYLNWRDFFNTRQLLCLGMLYKRILQIQDKKVREQFITLFSSTLEFNNLFCSFKGEGTGAVRHLFSNHILKPERIPLENNPWGTTKSSGAFSTLFKSKLIKAKEYLDHPFDLKVHYLNEKRITDKVVCSNSLNIKIANDWETFYNCDALVLNGNSAQLPIPDNSVDAIVTDPPYFDFIHYSELSDFFYAWLNIGLRKEYKYFNKENSADINEVQDKDSISFALKIGLIFRECYRVVKKDGLLTFSFHHSKIEGWIAIYEAIVLANFVIVASHPVKAEMDVASPKQAAKNPINIDAILVCKKTDISNDYLETDIKNVLKLIFDSCDKYIARFENINRRLSSADKFVIVCSQTLVYSSKYSLDIGQTRELMINASKLFETIGIEC